MSKKKIVNKTEKANKAPNKAKTAPKTPKKVETPSVTSNEVIQEKPVKKELTIFDKYRKHIDTVKEGYLKNLTYEEAMEMLRYIQKETHHQLGLNMSCSNCLIELVQIFMRLENK